MSLLDGALAAVLGAAFGAVFRDGVLHKMAKADLGTGGFTATATDYPVKVSLDQLGATERVATGIPNAAVRLILLRSGLAVAVDLDDGVTVEGATYRIIKVDTDPAMAAYSLMAVPA
jgi:hypothetical protein